MNFEELLNEYEKRFGKEYGIPIGIRKTKEEVTAEIEECLRTNTPQPDPGYDEDADY